MIGEWKVTSNPIGGKLMFAVYRKRFADEPLHSGNIEYGSEYIADCDEAQAIADRLNEKAPGDAATSGTGAKEKYSLTTE